MPNPKLCKSLAQQAVAAVNSATQEGRRLDGMPSAFSAAAVRLHIPRGTLYSRIRTAERVYGLYPVAGKAPEALPEEPSLPVFPDEDLPVESLIETMCTRFERRMERRKAERWFRIKMPDNKPFALVFFGDPHLDSNGCNWPLLREDCRIVTETPGMYGANVGDLVDNWTGRLMHLYAESDQSESTGWKFVEWFFRDSGVRWLLHVLGNHDQWRQGGTIIKLLAGQHVPVLADEARFVLETPNGATWPVHVRHNFEGHSMWNTLHGPQKAARMKEAAALYLCGHLHNWALHEEESASRGHVYWLARARGYKYIDPYQTALGHDAQEYGASIVAVCNPAATRMPNRMRCFPDVTEAADYLTYLRARKV